MILSNYGLIGNSTSAALVSRIGSIDWLCLPFVDSPPRFSAISGEEAGGKFQLSPVGEFRSRQRYRKRTFVLETFFETQNGRAVLTDWMPFGSEPFVHRRLDAISGKTNWSMTCSPRFFHAERFLGGILFRKGLGDIALLRSEVPVSLSTSPAFASSRFSLSAGESARFTWGWGRSSLNAHFGDATATTADWRKVAHRCRDQSCLVTGPWHDLAARSLLLLNLTSAESITGSRNASIRDCAVRVGVLSRFGFREEAETSLVWLVDLISRDGPEGLQSIYSLDGARFSSKNGENGVEGSRPEAFGQIAAAAFDYYETYRELPRGVFESISRVADHVCRAWRRPDYGISEVTNREGRPRRRAEHYVASKVLNWVALARSAHLARELSIEPPQRWLSEGAILRKTILEHGFDSSVSRFVRAFGSRDTDASVFLIPLSGFLPADDPRVRASVTAARAHLPDDELASRLLSCSCLALEGALEEAERELARIAAHATPLGFFGSSFDAFPSISTHLALLDCALRLERARVRARTRTRAQGASATEAAA